MLRSKLANSLALVGAVVALTHATANAVEPTPSWGASDVICVPFEDGSFMCGHPAPGPHGGYLDRTRPYIVGCVPDEICDSPDGARYEGLDGLYSEVVFPTTDPRYPNE